MHRELCTSPVRLCLPIYSTSVGGIRQFIFQIPIIDATLMGYCIAGQVKTMVRSVMCEINLRMGENILRRVLVMPFEVLLRDQLGGTRSIVLLISGRGRVDVLGDSLWQFWYSLYPCPETTCFPGNWCLIGKVRLGHF